jgi:superfamily II DNA/RNA helicase
MRQGAVSVLVCSDAFARGMDFADVQVIGTLLLVCRWFV